MADSNRDRLDQPREYSRRLPTPRVDQEAFGRFSERIARFMGTAKFLLYMTGFVFAWVVWNLLTTGSLRFDEYPFIFLTLMLSLQASYAAPLILLAQNRQDDRDRVAFEQDRARDERNLADTEYLTREVAALRIAMRDMATRDFLRSELRAVLDEFEQRGALAQHTAPAGKRKKPKRPQVKDAVSATTSPSAPGPDPAGPGVTTKSPPRQPTPTDPDRS